MVPFPPLQSIRSVAVIRPDEIGDVVLTAPLLRELRHNLPSAKIALVVKPATFNLVETCPYVDHVYAAPLGPTFGRRSRIRQWLQLFGFAWSHLRGQFDLVIHPRLDTDWYGGRTLVSLSGAKLRLGPGSDDALFTHLSPAAESQHDVERNLDVLQWMGGTIQSTALELWTTPQDAGVANAKLGATGDRPFIATCLAAGGKRKVWPVERFAEVFRPLIENDGARLVVIGAKADQPLANSLSRALKQRVIDLTGQTTLRETAEILRRCQLYLGNDTGPMHIAAAAGVPVVGIFCHPRDGNAIAVNSPARFAPVGVPSVVIQPAQAVPPCVGECIANEPHCILGVSVEAVRDAVNALRPRWETAKA